VSVELKPGARFRSPVCTTEVVVVKAPAGASVDLRCGGEPVVPVDQATQEGSLAPAAGFDSGTLLGKRYADDDLGLEVLCTKAGAGSLSIGEAPLGVKQPKPLPSSD
jgi:hypothetical protein